MSETWDDYGPGQGKGQRKAAGDIKDQTEAPERSQASVARMEGPETPICPHCQTQMDEVQQLNERGSLGWGYAGHASNRLYLMGMIRESGMAVKTARLRAYCCPKCRRGEFRY